MASSLNVFPSHNKIKECSFFSGFKDYLVYKTSFRNFRHVLASQNNTI